MDGKTLSWLDLVSSFTLNQKNTPPIKNLVWFVLFLKVYYAVILKKIGAIG